VEINEATATSKKLEKRRTQQVVLGLAQMLHEIHMVALMSLLQ